MKIEESVLTIGLDVGGAAGGDFSAVAIDEVGITADRDIVHHIRHLQRFPLGESFGKMIDEVLRMRDAVPELGKAPIVIDATGVGRPIVEMMRDRLPKRLRKRVVPVVITSGDHVNEDPETDGYRVPKIHLVNRMIVALEQGRMKIGRVPFAEELRSELIAFESKTSVTGRMSYNAASGHHDDLVLAVSLAAFGGEIRPPRLPRPKRPEAPLRRASQRGPLRSWQLGEPDDERRISNGMPVARRRDRGWPGTIRQRRGSRR